jgi:hypothetical protein
MAALHMSRDIDTVLATLTRALPGLRWEQLRVAHPDADDAGVWFVAHPASPHELQLETSTGMFPILLEGSDGPERDILSSVAEVVARVAVRLGMPSAAI